MGWCIHSCDWPWSPTVKMLSPTVSNPGDPFHNYRWMCRIGTIARDRAPSARIARWIRRRRCAVASTEMCSPGIVWIRATFPSGRFVCDHNDRWTCVQSPANPFRWDTGNLLWFGRMDRTSMRPMSTPAPYGPNHRNSAPQPTHLCRQPLRWSWRRMKTES